MNDIYKNSILKAIEALKNADILYEAGLTDEELSKIEATFDINFPPDLRFFYQNILPVSIKSINDDNLFPQWRKALSDENIKARILDFDTWIFEGIEIDIKINNFWMEEWGIKPSSVDEQIKIANLKYKQAPKLIQIYQHRCMPTSTEFGNPVYSIWQTDIIRYGNDLVSYLNNEFKLKLDYVEPEASSAIPFWDKMVGMNGRNQ